MFAAEPEFLEFTSRYSIILCLKVNLTENAVMCTSPYFSIIFTKGNILYDFCLHRWIMKSFLNRFSLEGKNLSLNVDSFNMPR